MARYPLIRTIYLYIFALLGLVLITIGTVRFVNMGLKAFVFTKADEDQLHVYEPSLPYAFDRVEKFASATSTDVADQTAAKQWIAEYKTWSERRSKVNYVTMRRHQDASLNIALILVGLPLYLYHWRIIQKETKDAGTA
jgi:hypothetical protein